MLRTTLKLRWMTGFTAFCCMAASCIKKSASSGTENQQPIQVPTESEDARATSKGLEAFVPLSPRTPLGEKIPDRSLVDVWIALALCECLPELQIALVSSGNSFRGALPQALTPAIRREIVSNPKLKILDIIPRPLDNIVGGIFADEVTVATEIHDALLTKIKLAEPEWSLGESATKLNLDSFIPLPGSKEAPTGRWVQLIDVWSRWGLILSEGGPWSRLRHTSPNKGLLWLELLRLLAEGEYLFGVSDDGKGNQWGGLTIPTDLQITNPGPFDPRKPYNQVRVLSGVLDLTLPSNNSLKLSRFGGERWSWRWSSLPLAEQAVQWMISARLLNRLRPANRGEFAKLFLNDSILPEDGYQLALLSLPGIDALLGGRYIDKNTRSIQSVVAGPEVGGIAQSSREKAEPLTLSFLLLALSAWNQELKNIADLKVSSETAKQLQSAPESLQLGAQLIVQTLLSEHLRPRTADSPDLPTTPWTLVTGTQNTAELPLRDHAQLLATLITAEKNIMPSRYLRGRIGQLAAGLAQRLNEATTGSAPPMLLAESLWLRMATSLFAENFPQDPSANNLAKRSEEQLGKLSELSRSALP